MIISMQFCKTQLGVSPRDEGTRPLLEKKIMQQIGKIEYLVGLYLAIILAFCFFMWPCIDTFYYFEWSKSLQLSYLDGPPLIAYFIRLITLIFGKSIFSLNLVGVFEALIISVFVYKIGAKFSKETAKLATSIWLVYPFITTRAIITNVTYDGLECALWMILIYYILQYLQHKKPYLIYVSGLIGGILILAKYQGIILLLGILAFFAFNRDTRRIYKSIHLYIAMLLTVGIFSPVLIWNYQHKWESFQFQLNAHSWQHLNNSSGWQHHTYFSGILFYLWNSLFCVAHILLLFLAYIYIKKRPQIKNYALQFLIFIASFTFAFWLIVSPFGHVSMNYLLPLTTILIIIATYYITKFNYSSHIKWFILVFILISMIMMIGHSTKNVISQQKCVYSPTTCYDKYIRQDKLPYLKAN